MNNTLKILYLSNTVFVFAASLLTPVYALFITKIGGGAELAGILFGIEFISVSLVSLVIIRLKDRTSLDHKLLHIGFLMRGFCWLLLAFIQTIPILLVVQVLTGIAEAVATPAFQTLVSEHLDREKRLTDYSKMELIKNPVIAIASILSGFIIARFGFNTLFGLMAIFAFTSSFVLNSAMKKNQSS